jgi:beta-carotene hydroxylase
MLRYKADRRTVLTVLIYYSVAILPWFLWRNMATWQIVLWVVVNCFFSFSCAVIIHNTIHAPIFKSKRVNKLFQFVLSFTYGHSVSAYVPGHNFSHHKYTQHPEDAIRTTKMRWRINFFNQLFFFHTMSGDIVKGEFAFGKRMLKERPEWFWQYALELGLVIASNIILLVINWKCALLFWVIPHQYAAWGIVGTNYFQHDGCDEEHQYNHTRNFTNKSLNFFLFNNGYHGAHHLKPNLHWSLLPAYHDQHIRPYVHPSLDRHSLIGYLIKAHIYPGKRLDYLGNPVVLPPKTEDKDWVSAVNIKESKDDMAAVA